MRKILFCIPGARTKEAGGSKVVVELVEEMRQIGWDCEILCPYDFPAPVSSILPLDVFHENLRKYLRAHADEFDVVDYDHPYLPYARQEFTRECLFVARSVLLTHHLDRIHIPAPISVRSVAGRILKGRVRKRHHVQVIQQAQRTIEEADLINVSNDADKTELLRYGIDANKIVVIPYGLSETRRPLFDRISSVVPEHPVVAFVGTFDYRKGAVDFPKIVDEVLKAVPQARYKLLGVQGMFRTEAQILSHFPRRHRKKIEVILKYKSEELPALLSDCSVGIFPSYLEGFGFGVLEMLSASMPVIAYNSPGPPMMLSSDYLVPPGDARTMGRRVAALLQNSERLLAARVLAKERSQEFAWKNIAKVTSEIYEEHCQKKIVERESALRC